VLSLKKYVPHPIYNSDDVVMSRENRNFHLRLFVKGGTLHNVPHSPLFAIQNDKNILFV
jgi:predicted acylesterase/phospholipase RssA